MKIDFNYKFVLFDGKTIPEGPDTIEEDSKGNKIPKKSPPFTLRTACVNVLLGTRLGQVKCRKCGTEIDKPEILSGDEKAKRYRLAKRIHYSKGLLDLEAEEISLLKKLTAIVLPQVTMGQAWDILDPHSADLPAELPEKPTDN